MELVLKLANVTVDIDRCLILILKTHLCTLLKTYNFYQNIENVQVNCWVVFKDQGNGCDQFWPVSLTEPRLKSNHINL